MKRVVKTTPVSPGRGGENQPGKTCFKLLKQLNLWLYRWTRFLITGQAGTR